MKKVLLFAIASLLLFSCKKKETQLSHVIDGVTLDSRAIAYPELSGVNLLLEEKLLESGVFNATFNELASTTSDNIGRYNFTFDKRTTLEYRLTATKANFFQYQAILDPQLIKPGVTYDKNVNLKPKAWINTKIINSFPIDDSDLITFKFMNASFDCNCCTNETSTYIGIDTDETNTCSLYGNTWIKYLTTVTKSGTPTITSIDSVFCNSFDTTFVEINF